MSKEPISNKSETDLQRLDGMSDEDIDFSDCPEVTPDMFASAVVRHGSRQQPVQKSITLMVDQDVLEWFEAQGEEAERQMALALRIYAEANKVYSAKQAVT